LQAPGFRQLSSFTDERRRSANAVFAGSLPVTFQHLAAGTVKFGTVLLQASKKDRVARPRRDGVAESADIGAARGLFIGAATLRDCRRGDGGQDSYQ
jgi:hypothetical protein